MSFPRDYIFWAYERGSIQYDVMVTAILLFIFVAPHYINFKDTPVNPVPKNSSQVLVRSNRPATNGDILFTYEISAGDLGSASSDAERNTAIMRIIEPIAGEVTLDNVQPVLDKQGKVVAYDATVRR